MSKISERIDDICKLVAEKVLIGFGISSPQAALLEENLAKFENELVALNIFPSDWMHKHSIGKGNLASVMWVVFLPPGQTTQDGIYVSFCFGKAGNGLVAGCAISNTSQKKYSYIPTTKRPNPEVDVDGTRPGTHYNDGYVNPLEVFAGKVNEEELIKHIKESVEKCQECLTMKKPQIAIAKSAKSVERYATWKKFLDKWSADSIFGFTLDKYTSFGGSYDSFCNWIEVRTESLGSIWGGSAYKFGVFEHNPNKLGSNDSTHQSDAKYSWYTRYGDSAEAVLAYVKNAYSQIIEAVEKGDISAIESINFGHAVKWKIAFLYQSMESPIILPIYKKEMLIKLTGMSKNTPTFEMQKKLMDAKPADQDLFDYYDELLEGLYKNDEDTDDNDDEAAKPVKGEINIETQNEIKLETFGAFIEEFHSAASAAGLKYEEGLVKRFVCALLAKPFVVLTGLSGSGKTKLAEAFTRWIAHKNTRQIVSVGADWVNNEKLLGYPNALDPKDYIMPDTGVLRLLLDANANPDIPFFLILDEMNLSHVERYFADFLSVMESKGNIKLHGDESRTTKDNLVIPPTIEFPKNLFVIGTMNVDETTHMFSPKVLDRAQVIEFKVSAEQMEAFLDAPNEPNMDALEGQGMKYATGFNALKDGAVSLEKDDKDKVAEAFKKFFPELAELGAEFAFRTAKEAMRFCEFAVKSGLGIDEAIDAAIMQKLLPKLHGSRRRLSHALETFWKFCLKSKDQTATVADLCKKDNALKVEDVAKYPLSAEKIRRMYKAVEANGFASYAEA